MGDRAHGLGTAVVECRSGDQTVQRMVRYEGMFHQHDKDMPGGRWMDRRPDTFESFQGVLDARGLPARGTLRTPLYWYEGDFHRGVRCGAGRQTIRVRDQTQEYDATVIAHWTSAPPACFGWLTLHRHPHHHTRYYGEMTADGLPDGRGTKLIDVPAHVEVQANMLASPLTLPCRLVQCGIFQQGLLADQARATIFYLTSRPPTWYVGPVMHAQPHGEEDGVLTCDGRQLYRGQWRHGRFHGRGKGVLRNQRGVDVLFDGVFVQGEAVQGATDRLVGSWTNGVGTLQFPPSVRIEYEGCTYAGGRYSGPVDREYPLAGQSASMQFGPPLVDVDDESWTQIQSMLYRLSPNTRAQVETRLGGGGAVPSAIALDDSPETRLVTTLSWVQHLVDNQQPVQFVESSPIVTIYTTKLTIF
jgi:hypothetical protein